MVGLSGKWKLKESENFDEFLQAIHVGAAKRALAATFKPTQEILVNGNTVTIKTSSTIKNTEITFTFGEEFEETTLDEHTLKTVVTKESDTKWVQRQHGDPERVITRELVGDEYVMTLEAGGKTAKRR